MAVNNEIVSNPANYPCLPTGLYPMSTAQHTAVHDSLYGAMLPANRIKANGSNIGIASQYPRPEVPHIAGHLRMLADNRTPVSVVLASKYDISKNNCVNYFKPGTHTYGPVTVSSTKTKRKTIQGMDVQHYDLTIMERGKPTVVVPLMHVENWADQTTLPANTLSGLVDEANTVAEGRRKIYANARAPELGNPDKMLPVVHCMAGVGRTGTYLTIAACKEAIAAMQRGGKNVKDMDVGSIVAEIRRSRNRQMINTDEQLNTVIDFARQHGIPLCKKTSTT